MGQQTPWDSSSLTRDFYFSPAAPKPAAPAVVAPKPAPVVAALKPAAQPEDDLLWRSVVQSNSPVQLRYFLERFPNSRHSGSARALLAALTPAPTTPSVPAIAPPSPPAIAAPRNNAGQRVDMLVTFDGNGRYNTCNLLKSSRFPIEVGANGWTPITLSSAGTTAEALVKIDANGGDFAVTIVPYPNDYSKDQAVLIPLDGSNLTASASIYSPLRFKDGKNHCGEILMSVEMEK